MRIRRFVFLAVFQQECFASFQTAEFTRMSSFFVRVRREFLCLE